MPCMVQISTTLVTAKSYDLRRTMSSLSSGRQDPTARANGQRFEFSLLTPSGAVTIQATPAPEQLQVQLDGAGAEWLVPHLGGLFGLNDIPTEFFPEHPVRALQSKRPGIHLIRVPVLFHRLVQIVLHQLVTWEEAAWAWQEMTRRYGMDAPGSSGLMTGPTPERLNGLAYFDLVDCGILPRQARLILRLAREARRIERVRQQGDDQLIAWLRKMPGIGDWTLRTLQGSCLADADAVVTGDYGLPHVACWFFKRQPRGTDAEMLELLEPYRGHRYRVLQLLMHAGVQAPRRGPKMRVRSWK